MHTHLHLSVAIMANHLVLVKTGWVIKPPYPLELLDEGLYQLCLLRDEDVLHVVLHRIQRPVEGAGDEEPPVHHRKLMVHVHRVVIASHADACDENVGQETKTREVRETFTLP